MIEVAQVVKMSAKVRVNELGQVLVKLPVSGLECKLRSPKGKDLKAIEAASSVVGASNAGTMMLLASLLCLEPQLSLEDVEELDAEDVMALGVALGNFRAFNQMGQK